MHSQGINCRNYSTDYAKCYRARAWSKYFVALRRLLWCVECGQKMLTHARDWDYVCHTLKDGTTKRCRVQTQENRSNTYATVNNVTGVKSRKPESVCCSPELNRLQAQEQLDTAHILAQRSRAFSVRFVAAKSRINLPLSHIDPISSRVHLPCTNRNLHAILRRGDRAAPATAKRAVRIICGVEIDVKAPIFERFRL